MFQCRAKPLERRREAKGVEVPVSWREACSPLSSVAAEHKQAVHGIGTVCTCCIQGPAERQCPSKGLSCFPRHPHYTLLLPGTLLDDLGDEKKSPESQTNSSPFPHAFPSADLPYQIMLLGGGEGGLQDNMMGIYLLHWLPLSSRQKHKELFLKHWIP